MLFTAYSIVRTVPSANGQTGGKKIQGQAQSWCVFVSKFNCLQYLISRFSLQLLKYSMGTGEGNLLWGLGGTAFFP